MGCSSSGSDFLYLQFNLYNLNSKSPTQTHQLHYPASIESFSDTIMSCRKMAVALKQSNVTFAEFFTSPANMLISPTNDYAMAYGTY